MSARRIEQHGPHAHTSFAEQRTGPQGITAVVARTDQQRHRPMRDRPCTGTQFVRDYSRKTVRRSTHQHPVGQLVEQRRLSCSHLIGCVVPTHVGTLQLPSLPSKP